MSESAPDRKRFLRASTIIAAALIVSLAVATGLAYSRASALQDENEDLESSIDQAMESLAESTTQLEEATQDLSQLQQTNERLSIQLKKARASNTELEGALAQTTPVSLDCGQTHESVINAGGIEATGVGCAEAISFVTGYMDCVVGDGSCGSDGSPDPGFTCRDESDGFEGSYVTCDSSRGTISFAWSP